MLLTSFPKGIFEVSLIKLNLGPKFRMLLTLWGAVLLVRLIIQESLLYVYCVSKGVSGSELYLNV